MYAQKLSIYHRACDSAQNGVVGKKIVMSLWPARSDKSFKYRFYAENVLTYFRMKKKESCEQRESTSTNSVAIFTEYHST